MVEFINKVLLASALALVLAYSGCTTVPDIEHDGAGLQTVEQATVQEGTLEDGTTFYKYLQPAEIREDHPLIRCTSNVLYKKAWLLAVYERPNGYVLAAVDTNRDGKKDVQFVFYPTNKELMYPDEYMVDLNYDGQPDAVYLDEGATGKCENIKPAGSEQPDVPVVPGHEYNSPPEAII